MNHNLPYDISARKDSNHPAHLHHLIKVLAILWIIKYSMLIQVDSEHSQWIVDVQADQSSLGYTCLCSK